MFKLKSELMDVLEDTTKRENTDNDADEENGRAGRMALNGKTKIRKV